MENESKYATLYIVRHGESQWNLQGLVQGQQNPELTERGKNQAKERAKDLADIKFEAVFSSDLLRAHQTAQIIAAEKQLAITTTKLLRERRFGKFEAVPKVDYKKEAAKMLADFTKLSLQQQLSFKLDENMEADSDLFARMQTFLREISAAYLGKNVLVATHGGMIRSLLVHLGFVKPAEYKANWMSNAGYIILLSDGVDFKIKQVIGLIPGTPPSGSLEDLSELWI